MTTRIVNTLDEVHLYRVTGKRDGRVAAKLQIVAPSLYAAAGIVLQWYDNRPALGRIEWTTPKRARSYNPEMLTIGVYPQFEVTEEASR